MAALLIVAGIAFAIWWFVLREGGRGNGGPADRSGPSQVSPGGVSFYTAGDDGAVHRWVPEYHEAQASAKVDGAITALVVRGSGKRLVLGTSKGIVMQLDANTLNVHSGMELRVGGMVTSILPIGMSQLLVRDGRQHRQADAEERG